MKKSRKYLTYENEAFLFTVFLLESLKIELNSQFITFGVGRGTQKMGNNQTEDGEKRKKLSEK